MASSDVLFELLLQMDQHGCEGSQVDSTCDCYRWICQSFLVLYWRTTIVKSLKHQALELSALTTSNCTWKEKSRVYWRIWISFHRTG